MRGARRGRQDGERLSDGDSGELRLRLGGHFESDRAFSITAGMKLRVVGAGSDVPVHRATEMFKPGTV